MRIFSFWFFPFGAIIYFIKLYKKKHTKPFADIAYSFLGVLYVAVPFALLHVIAFTTGEYRYEIVAGILLLTWASDTGGLFCRNDVWKNQSFQKDFPKKVLGRICGWCIANAWNCLHNSDVRRNISGMEMDDNWLAYRDCRHLR
jgi:CDP-diglyceride synthetase